MQLFEVPSNLVLKKLKPSRYIASIAIIWGIIATLTGICQNYGGLIACRLLLGNRISQFLHSQTQSDRPTYRPRGSWTLPWNVNIPDYVLQQA